MQRDSRLPARRVVLLLSAAAAVLFARPGAATAPVDPAALPSSSGPTVSAQEQLGLPEIPRNLQVLPADMSTRAVVGVMRGFAGALGVRCIHCHVGDDPRDLSSVDFVSDARETKRIARVMMRMVEAINESHLSKVVEMGRQDALDVGCATCHHGQPRPLTLEDVLTAALESGGVEAMLARHDELRERYYGSGTYDFTERSLAGVSQRLARTGAGEAAVALAARNIELHPDSFMAQVNRAQVSEAVGDVEEAKAGWRACLNLDPELEFCRQQLDRLEGEQRR